MTDSALHFIFLSMISTLLLIPIAKENPKWQSLFCCGLLLVTLHLLSLYNVFISVLPGADLDAQTFWETASNAANRKQSPAFHIGDQAYVVIIYWKILATVNQLHIIQLFSLIFSALNILLITRLFKAIGGNTSHIWIALLLLWLSPSFLLHSSVTLREPLQLFSILLFIYFTNRMRTFRGLYLSAFFLTLAAVTHQALLIYSVVILILYSLIFIGKSNNNILFPSNLSVFVGTLVIFAGFFIYYVPVLSGHTLANLNKQGILEHLLAYRQPIEQGFANTAHNLTLSFDTLSSAVQSILLNYVYYLFNPIINFKFTLEYSVLFWEAIIRVAGISLMLIAVIREKNNPTHLLLIVLYISLTLIWSLGTANDGQAFRHHVLTQWIMCIYIARYIQQRLNTNNLN